MIPKTVKSIGKDALTCFSLRWVDVEEGCQADVKGVTGVDVVVQTFKMVTVTIPDGTKVVTEQFRN